MKLSEFILLNENEKTSAVLHIGILVAKRKKEDLTIFLFQLDNYYVETYCNVPDKQVYEFKAFNNTKNLAPYLEAISIDELLNWSYAAGSPKTVLLIQKNKTSYRH